MDILEIETKETMSREERKVELELETDERELEIELTW